MMDGYPKNWKKHLRIFTRHFDGKLEKFEQKEAFANMITNGNPFLNDDLMISWKSKKEPFMTQKERKKY